MQHLLSFQAVKAKSRPGRKAGKQAAGAQGRGKAAPAVIDIDANANGCADSTISHNGSCLEAMVQLPAEAPVATRYTLPLVYKMQG